MPLFTPFKRDRAVVVIGSWSSSVIWRRVSESEQRVWRTYVFRRILLQNCVVPGRVRRCLITSGGRRRRSLIRAACDVISQIDLRRQPIGSVDRRWIRRHAIGLVLAGPCFSVSVYSFVSYYSPLQDSTPHRPTILRIAKTFSKTARWRSSKSLTATTWQ